MAFRNIVNGINTDKGTFQEISKLPIILSTKADTPIQSITNIDNGQVDTYSESDYFMAFKGETYYTSNTAIFSTDGINWSPKTFPLATGWRSAASGNGKTVVVGAPTSNYVYSSDRQTWTVGTLPYSGGSNKVVYANGIFVSIGLSSTNNIAYSSDGINWSLANVPILSNQALINIVYANGIFLVTGSKFVLYSENGISWKISRLPQITNVQALSYGDNTFIILGVDNFGSSLKYSLISKNGVDWTVGSMPNYNWSSIAYGNGKFVAVSGRESYSGQEIAYSTDGLSWTMITGYSLDYYAQKQIVYNNFAKKFMVFSSSSYVDVSEDGVVWSKQEVVSPYTNNSGWPGYYASWSQFNIMLQKTKSIKNQIDSISNSLEKDNYNDNIEFLSLKKNLTALSNNVDISNSQILVKNKDNILMTIGNQSGSTTEFLYSIDGISWTKSYVPANTTWRSLSYLNGKIILFAYSLAFYSTDAVTWTQISLPYSAEWSSSAYGNNKYIAMPSKTSLSSYYLKSTDGISWTSSSITSGTWGAVAYGNGKFIAVETQSGGGKRYAYSTDGESFTIDTTSLPAGNWGNIVYKNNLFILTPTGSNAGGAYALVGAYSADGVTWTSFTYPASLPFSVEYIQGTYVFFATNTSGPSSSPLYYTTNFINWTTVNIDQNSTIGSNYSPMARMMYNGSKAILFGANNPSVYSSTNGTSWTLENGSNLMASSYLTAFGNVDVPIKRSLSSVLQNVISRLTQ